ncbi:hypothetical protein PAV_6c03800 [Paenibacillus alvei DSM 29]|nr:hypothetical protein PAV_6c03800 [Paenibacillus alvei DSM 29]
MTGLLCCILMFTQGCSSMEMTPYKELAKAFKQAQYDVPDYTQITGAQEEVLARYEKIKPYLTQESYYYLFRERSLVVTLGAARKQQCNIVVTSFQFEQESEADGGKTFTYSMTLELRNGQGQVMEEIEVSAGQMEFAIQDGGLFIARDHDGNPLSSKYN